MGIFSFLKKQNSSQIIKNNNEEISNNEKVLVNIDTLTEINGTIEKINSSNLIKHFIVEMNFKEVLQYKSSYYFTFNVKGDFYSYKFPIPLYFIQNRVSFLSDLLEGYYNFSSEYLRDLKKDSVSSLDQM